MLLLALDTSTRQASVALSTENELLGEYTWHVGNNHSVELLERIQRIAAECNRTMQDIDAVAVATGPGSFNGVRVAVSVAKTLAFSLQKPLVGISTLDIIAAQQQHWQGPVCSIMEAGRSELYAACYTFDKTSNSEGEINYSMRQLSDFFLLSPQHLASNLQEQANIWFGIPGERELPLFLFCGEITLTSRQMLFTQMQEKCFFVNTVQSSRHASILAMLALQRLYIGNVDDPLMLEPLYIRRPSITTSTRKQALLGGKSNRPAGHSPQGPGQTEREQGALRH